MPRLDDMPALTQTHVSGSVSDRLAAAAAAALVGRTEERARLSALLAPNGPAAVFVHGPGGIGKTTLVTGVLAPLPVNWVSLDGRHMEPTVPGMLAALGAALGRTAPPSATAAAERDTDLFRGMFTNPALKDVTVREYHVLEAPTAITAPTSHGASPVPDAL